MIILNIAELSNKKFVGPNINVPANVLYGEKSAITGLYNTGNESLDNVKELKYYFRKEQMQKNDVSTLPEPFNKPDLVVFNSMYIIKHVKIARKLIKRGIPYIIIPRGALTRKAQQKKWYKKKIANLVIFKNYIKNATAIHFLTEMEYEESKKFKIKQHIISGNGTITKKTEKKKENKEKFVITFIGRIDRYHKGLDTLLEAINLGKEKIRSYCIEFKIYGPNYDNSIEYLKNKINEYKINDIVMINGPVYDKEKEEILINSDLFIHTSRLEGHPTSIIEAISYGIPVLVTPGTNMAGEVKKYNLGFVAELNAQSIENTIIDAYKNRNNFFEISNNEINYSKENFAWEIVMKRTINNYKNILLKYHREEK